MGEQSLQVRQLAQLAVQEKVLSLDL
jgi:hypothetical protein